MLTTRQASLAGLVSMFVVGASVPARAEPQASVGLTGGAAVQDVASPGSVGISLHLGARGDVLFLRDHNGRMAVGPYADAATAGFHDLDTGGGIEWLLPLTSDVPVVLSAGGLVRNGDGRSWAPGLEGTVFVGSRSFNFHSWYGLAAGVFAQTRWVPTSPSTTDLVFGVQLDLELVVLPALLLWEVISHGS